MGGKSNTIGIQRFSLGKIVDQQICCHETPTDRFRQAGAQIPQSWNQNKGSEDLHQQLNNAGDQRRCFLAHRLKTVPQSKENTQGQRGGKMDA